MSNSVAQSTQMQVVYQPQIRHTAFSSCPRTDRPLVGLRCTDNRIYKFETNENGDLIEHRCECQAKVVAEDLLPRYAIFVPNLNDYMIFVYNMVSRKVEQYMYNVEHFLLCQVEIPELPFENFKCVKNTDTVVIVNRDIIFEIDKAYRFIKASQIRPEGILPIEFDVKTYMETPYENEKVYKRIYETDPGVKLSAGDKIYQDYLKLQPPLKISYCSHYAAEVVLIFSTATQLYVTRAFDYGTGKYTEFNCSHCPDPNIVTEAHLYPKYAQYCAPLRNYLIHMKNYWNGTMEQYVYDYTTDGLVQVSLPEFPYDASKDLEDSRVLFSIKGSSDEPVKHNLVILKDARGMFRKEHFCPTEGRFIPSAPVPVLTTFVQRRQEMERKAALNVERPISRQSILSIESDEDYVSIDSDEYVQVDTPTSPDTKKEAAPAPVVSSKKKEKLSAKPLPCHIKELTALLEYLTTKTTPKQEEEFQKNFKGIIWDPHSYASNPLSGHVDAPSSTPKYAFIVAPNGCSKMNKSSTEKKK